MSKENSGKKEQQSLTLPQNVLFMGEHVEEDKNIYISQSVYKEIHAFTKDKTKNESGGVLMGDVVDALGKTNIIITGFIEAKHEEATPTTLKFTHETWEEIHKVVDKKYEGKKMLGWIHTHPNFGIFLSEYDRFIHENYFNEEYEVAYVVDPIQHIEGFYFWIDGKLERCKGFYVFDKVGKKIVIEEECDKHDTNIPTKSIDFSWQNILIIVLMIVSMLLGISNINLSKKVSKLTSTINKYDEYFQTYPSLIENNNNLIRGYENLKSNFDELTKRLDFVEYGPEENIEDNNEILEDSCSEDSEQTSSNQTNSEEQE